MGNEILLRLSAKAVFVIFAERDNFFSVKISLKL